MAFNNDRVKYNEYMRNYLKQRYDKRRAAAIEKLGGECEICGCINNLEFDHIYREDKDFNIAKRMHGANDKDLEIELAKCQLLCHDCHNTKTIKDIGKEKIISSDKTILVHGTLSSCRYCKCDLCKKAKADYSKEYNKTHIRKRDRH